MNRILLLLYACLLPFLAHGQFYISTVVGTGDTGSSGDGSWASLFRLSIHQLVFRTYLALTSLSYIPTSLPNLIRGAGI